MSPTQEREQLVEKALEAFWGVIAKGTPEAVSGDAPWDFVDQVTVTASNWVDAWRSWNVPTESNS